MLEALENGIKSMGSLTKFSDIAAVNKKTLAQFLSRKTHSLTADTWEKIYPLLRPYLPEHTDDLVTHVTRKQTKKVTFTNHKPEELSSDEIILLDAFGTLTPKLRNEKLIEIVELSRKEIKLKNQE